MPTPAVPLQTTPRPQSPAFKEWQVIVAALAAGEQSLLLRKGGLAEGRGGFDSAHAERFWLFPTQFHAQLDKTKPALARHWTTPCDETPASPVMLTAFAEVIHQQFITDWPIIVALDPFHGWTEAAVREKFEWGPSPGVHALIVQVHRLNTPIRLDRTPAMAGCKSWIELPLAFDDYAGSPVVPHYAPTALLAALGRC
jgi:hypothetical protein